MQKKDSNDLSVILKKVVLLHNVDIKRLWTESRPHVFNADISINNSPQSQSPKLFPYEDGNVTTVTSRGFCNA